MVGLLEVDRGLLLFCNWALAIKDQTVAKCVCRLVTDAELACCPFTPCWTWQASTNVSRNDSVAIGHRNGNTRCFRYHRIAIERGCSHGR